MTMTTRTSSAIAAPFPPVLEPEAMNAAFAAAANSGDVRQLLALYADDAILRTDATATHRGHAAIREALNGLLQLGGTMVSLNNFCIVHGDLALLRADFTVTSAQGAVLAQGSTAELARRQPDGHWLYVIDHAAGASLPAVAA